MESNNSDVIASLSNLEVEDLRSRLALAEAQNASLTAELRKAQAAAGTVKAQLERQLADLQRPLPGTEASSTRPFAVGAVPEEGEAAILPISSQRTASAPLKTMKDTLGRVSVIIARGEVVWDNFPATGYVIKPDRRLSKKSNWTTVKHGKLRRPANELMACISGVWYYLGTYTSVSSETFPAQSFRELSEEVQSRVIMLAGTKSRRDGLRSMLENGEITMTKISLRRVGVNQRVWDCLASSANVGIGGAQGEESEGSDDTD
ncbi:uncharacterized protein B0H18DRAFT_231035 [Fomitopsis serialis]|uniref:uncharacterized protein n=1 Tax=Fomitopsis serialis TaxID=139415 RepID=UPI0020080189|nr:uncharacterized protein B0H18DRAFT_231035 [Neoantrodia serialis]KAH9928816.1 hypothetical protein B0H18DRAFT_231035 [Neoantrodia serialis]